MRPAPRPGGPRRPRAPAALGTMAVLAVVLAGCTGAPSGEEVGPLVGNKAPPVETLTIDGEEWRLADATAEGDVVLLDLMGVNCPPCRAQMPHLQQVADAHADDARLRLLSIDMASVYPGLGARNEQEIVDFRDEFNATWPFAPDRQGQVGQAYEPIAIPTLVLIGPDGIIRFKHSGGVITAEDIEAQIAEMHPGAMTGGDAAAGAGEGAEA